MSYILLVLKGMLFGIANIIPGVSGGTMAIVTGVYEKLIDSINNIFKKFKTSIIFLLIFGLGAAFAVVVGSKGIKIALQYFEFPISMLFVGLILGSFGSVIKPVKGKLRFHHYMIILITFAFVIGLLYIPFPKANTGDLKFYDYLILVLCGFLASVAMVVPGISGMMMFYLFGYYDVIMSAISNLTSFSTIGSSILTLLPVGIGIIIGLFTAAKVISILFKKYPNGTYAAIIGFVIGSIFALAYEGGIINEFIKLIEARSYTFKFTSNETYYNGTYEYNFAFLLIGIIALLTGLLGSLLIVTLANKKELEEKETEELVNKKREEIKQELLKEIAEMNNKPGDIDDN